MSNVDIICLVSMVALFIVSISLVALIERHFNKKIIKKYQQYIIDLQKERDELWDKHRKI